MVNLPLGSEASHARAGRPTRGWLAPPDPSAPRGGRKAVVEPTWRGAHGPSGHEARRISSSCGSAADVSGFSSSSIVKDTPPRVVEPLHSSNVLLPHRSMDDIPVT